MSELELCPKCKKGHLRPTGLVGIDRDPELSVKTGESRRYECDNPECEMRRSDLVHSEHIPVSASASLEVTKAEDLEKMENNPRICTVCQNEKEIVYRKETVKLCKECLDKIKRQDER